jgi:DUF4097 and DUF4098 domain-containing protein YvlB
MLFAAVAMFAPPFAATARNAIVPQHDPVLTARHMNQGASLKVFNATGAVRLVGWSHDSMEVRGNVTPRRRYYAAGDANGAKVGVDDGPSNEPPPHGDLTIYVPRGTQVSVKTVNGNVETSDVSGWFYSIAGSVRIGGNAKSIEVDAMRGDIDLAVSVPWMHVRAGEGHVVVHGIVTDADISTIGGKLDIASGAIQRGRFASVAGDIRWTGAPAPGAILDFSNHNGAVEFVLPRSTAATFSLSTVGGTITNGFAQVRPVSQAERSVRVTFGRGGADIAVRTFKGAIRMRPQ